MTRYLLRERAPLKTRNTMGVAAEAELFADVRDTDALSELLSLPYVQQSPLLVLGEGSNVLLVEDVPGLVLSLGNLGIEEVARDGERVRVRVQAGERWDDLVRWSVGRDLHGIENMALIPGAVGAAPIQNIGAYGQDVAQCLVEVEAFDRKTLQAVRLSRDDCTFGYRDSVFKREPEHWVITALTLELKTRGELRLDYHGVLEELATMAVERPRPVHAAEVISRIRTRKLPNPHLLGNSGSFFKNPEVELATALRLQKDHPTLPAFGTDPEHRKLSAGWLIETCGWRGFREGDAGVAEQHALVLVNHGNASGRQILDLARRIADSVHARFGVRLEPEPRLVGARW